MYAKIVVGADSSETAAAAVAHAEKLAALAGAELHIVSAYKPVSVADVPFEFRDSVRPDSAVESLLADLVARSKVAGITVHSHDSTGDPASSICKVAKDVGADLIVVGNKGMKGIRSFVLGSVPNKVAHDAPCSTLIVHTT